MESLNELIALVRRCALSESALVEIYTELGVNYHCSPDSELGTYSPYAVQKIRELRTKEQAVDE